MKNTWISSQNPAETPEKQSMNPTEFPNIRQFYQGITSMKQTTRICPSIIPSAPNARRLGTRLTHSKTAEGIGA